MHCKGMHLFTFLLCWVGVGMAKRCSWNPQRNLWCQVVILHINDWAPLFFPSSFVCVHCCVLCNPAKGRTNMELREKFILADGASQGMAAFRPRGRRSRPSSRGASPNRSTSLSSQAGQAASPQVPVTSTPKVGCEHETFLCFYTIGVLRILWNVLGP